MDSSILVTLANLGGGFTIAAVLLWLHKDALKSFREELKEEREANAKSIKEERELFEQRHQKLISMAVSFHDKEMEVIREVRDDVRDVQRVPRNGQLHESPVPTPERGKKC
jgi:hypothetical protein